MRIFLLFLLFVTPLNAQTDNVMGSMSRKSRIDAVSLEQFSIQQGQQLERFKQEQSQRLELLKQQQVLVRLMEQVNHQKALMNQLAGYQDSRSLKELQKLQNQTAQQQVIDCPT